MLEAQEAILIEVLSKGGTQKAAAEAAGVDSTLVCKYLKTKKDFKEKIEQAAYKFYRRNLPKAIKNFNHALDKFLKAKEGTELQKMGWAATNKTLNIFENPGVTIQNIINYQENTIITPVIRELLNDHIRKIKAFIEPKQIEMEDKIE